MLKKKLKRNILNKTLTIYEQKIRKEINYVIKQTTFLDIFFLFK